KEILLHLDNKSIKYGYIPQDYLEVLDKNLSVIDFLIINQDKYVEYRLRQILGQLGFKKDEMNELIGNISEGQKLKVLLLLMVSKDIELIVLDEPTRNISPINQDEIYNLFLDYSGAIVAVTHDREFIESVFDKIYELTPNGLI
ncbi:MAG: ATP-binding cassette domain-containing protein, partial [Candidatus Izemoplasmatales bacterium]|nr:ATP-binding cassette domain-containing protein [Candidatus Izemoplasmatales bacterium]